MKRIWPRWDWNPDTSSNRAQTAVIFNHYAKSYQFAQIQANVFEQNSNSPEMGVVKDTTKNMSSIAKGGFSAILAPLQLLHN